MSRAISIVDEVTPLLQRLGDPTPAGRKIINTGIAGEVADCVRNYLRAWNRHESASKVGGTPTQFMRHAAEATDYVASEDECSVVINSPGFARVDQDVDIYPVNKTYLTIPIAAEAYGHTIRDFPAGVFLRGKGEKGKASLIYGLPTAGDIHPLYALVTHVHQVQDRTLLPSDEQLVAAGMRGADEAIQDIMDQSAGGHAE